MLIGYKLQALTKSTKRGCGASTVLLYSGWNWVPTYQRLEGTSTISTKPLSGLMPLHFIPAASNASLKALLNSYL